MFSYLSPEQRVRADHPLRAIRTITDHVLRQAREAALLSDEHFTVDGTLLEAWAGLKSVQRTDADPPPAPDDPGNPIRMRSSIARGPARKPSRRTWGTCCSTIGMAW